MTSQPKFKSSQLSVFCDGGARGNPGPAAVGFVIRDAQGYVLAEKGEYFGQATNNVAEYQGVIKSLEWLINYQKNNSKFLILNSKFFLDSQLIVNQLMGRYKIKKPHLQQLAIRVKELESQLKTKITYQYVPREQNQRADKLLNQALDLKLQK